MPQQAGVHPKPANRQAALIAAVTDPGNVVLAPAAGSYSVLAAVQLAGREFLGCDVETGAIAYTD